MTQIAPVHADKNIVNSTNKKMPFGCQKGQGMTEYIIIVALIAVAAIAVYQFFGQTIRSQTSAIANEVAGQSGTVAVTAAQTAATATATERNAKGLANYVGGAAAAGGTAPAGP